MPSAVLGNRIPGQSRVQALCNNGPNRLHRKGEEMNETYDPPWWQLAIIVGVIFAVAGIKAYAMW